jgi:hypothetical protein
MPETHAAKNQSPFSIRTMVALEERSRRAEYVSAPAPPGGLPDGGNVRVHAN